MLSVLNYYINNNYNIAQNIVHMQPNINAQQVSKCKLLRMLHSTCKKCCFVFLEIEKIL